MTGLATTSILLPALFGLAAGIGITAVGPGGVLATIGLLAFTDLSPAEVAGTALVTHVATGALGTAAYARSGQLADPATRRVAFVLIGTAAAGTPLGVLVNAQVTGRAFGVLLGIFAAAVAALVWYRERSGARRARPEPPLAALVPLGLAIAAVSGFFGVGGPMLTVPVLVALGVPLLHSLAAAQAQSVVISAVGTVGYVLRDAVDWPLAALVGVPELAGVLIGWAVARAVPTRVLTRALIAVLLCLAPYLAWHG